jgi:hypothetical protein
MQDDSKHHVAHVSRQNSMSSPSNKACMAQRVNDTKTCSDVQC